jgi:hypothetical protein
LKPRKRIIFKIMLSKTIFSHFNVTFVIKY